MAAPSLRVGGPVHGAIARTHPNHVPGSYHSTAHDESQFFHHLFHISKNRIDTSLCNRLWTQEWKPHNANYVAMAEPYFPLRHRGYIHAGEVLLQVDLEGRFYAKPALFRFRRGRRQWMKFQEDLLVLFGCLQQKSKPPHLS